MIPADVREKVERRLATLLTIREPTAYARAVIETLVEVVDDFNAHDAAEKAERAAHGDALEDHYGVGGL